MSIMRARIVAAATSLRYAGTHPRPRDRGDLNQTSGAVQMLSTRTISSSRTFLMKVVVPVSWISMFGWGTIMLWLNAMHGQNNEPPTYEMKFAFLAAWIGGTAFLLWSCARLKRVRIDDDNLYISNFRGEMSVPLSAIADVTENRWINNHPVTIHFRKDMGFGRSIIFMPTYRFLGFWSSHPVVAELLQLSRQKARRAHIDSGAAGRR